MALKTQFPLFAPPPLRPEPQRPPTEIRFSRWNNANAQKFIRRERDQKEIEDRLRFERRFDSALTIAHNYNPAPPHLTIFKSNGTPSEPSSPSIPGKKSKYSKPPSSASRKAVHPAFKTLVRPRKIPERESETESEGEGEGEGEHAPRPSFKIDENGVSYEMPEAPFVYQYSYTETPKLKPVKLREPLVSPFGPSTMAKPWMGRKPMNKKILPEFDSFKLPPPQKKGVKPVQAPGPFLPGSGPKYVKSREEILGDPLTKEETVQLINGSIKSRRQLNMGRDGLTHNMLDNVHALWKRRRVCRIKCKGVCTVDMENVCQQLEEKTGGKIIYSKGGVIYLFRGRNYNFKTRPRYPLMLWKPASPVYPRLVKRVPVGLTLEEAIDMRKRGCDLIPIAKLAKNGLYSDLSKNVREAFEACELVRINCEGLNPSDFKKIGAKLQTLVPCVLLSFEREHILMWRGRDWKSSFVEPSQSPLSFSELKDEVVTSGPILSPSSNGSSISILEADTNPLERSLDVESPELVKSVEIGQQKKVTDVPDRVPSIILNVESINEPEESPVLLCSSCHSGEVNQIIKSEKLLFVGSEESQATLENAEADELLADIPSIATQLQEELINTENANLLVSSDIPSHADGILLLRKQAVENMMAFVLGDHGLDADAIFKQAVTFSKTAPSGPVFRLRSKKAASQKNRAQELDDSKRKEAPVVTGTIIVASGRREKRTSSKNERREDIKADHLNFAPQGSLRVDELAKLLA